MDMKAATQLMKKAFPKIGGLNYTVLGSHWNFAKPEQVPWIQVIRDSDRRHWLVATSKDGKSDKIYDSMQGTKGLNQHVVGCVCLSTADQQELCISANVLSKAIKWI